MEKNELYIQLIIKQLSNEISTNEKDELKKWLEESEEHHLIQNEVISSWEQAKHYKSELIIDKTLAWKNIEQKVLAPAVQKPKVAFLQIAQIAAILIVMLGLSYFLSGNFTNEELQFQTKNNVEQIVLPDGSKVWLNSYSKLNYSSNSKARIVELIGEAYFNIEHNAEKPFSVFANATETRVLGTEFNVINRAESSELEVSLFKGSISFASAENNELMLVPGETVQFDKSTNSLSKFETNTGNLLAWKSGVLEFENTDVLIVLKELEEHYEKTLEVTLDTSVNCVFTGKFEQIEFQEVLEVLSYTYDLKYQDQGENHYSLEIKNCH